MKKHVPPRTRGAEEKWNLFEELTIAPPVLGRFARERESGWPVEYRRDTFYSGRKEKEQFSEMS